MAKYYKIYRVAFAIFLASCTNQNPLVPLSPVELPEIPLRRITVKVLEYCILPAQESLNNYFADSSYDFLIELKNNKKYYRANIDSDRDGVLNVKETNSNLNAFNADTFNLGYGDLPLYFLGIFSPPNAPCNNPGVSAHNGFSLCGYELLGSPKDILAPTFLMTKYSLNPKDTDQLFLNSSGDSFVFNNLERIQKHFSPQMPLTQEILDLYGYRYTLSEYPHNGQRCFDIKIENFALAEPTRNLFRFFIIKNNVNGTITLEARQLEITDADINQSLNSAEFLFSEMQPL